MKPLDEEYWLSRARAGDIPAHIGIIMDGNGRWAKHRGKNRQEGHRAGVETIRRCIPALVNLGVKYCTLFVFSTENWKRPLQEVQFLLGLVIDYTKKHKNELIENGIRVIPVGRWNEMPQLVVSALKEVAKETEDCKNVELYLAINYGGRQEILDAALAFARQCHERPSAPDNLSEDEFSSFLYAKGIPDPDLIIRTSGEMRLSNFLLWQCAYSEFVFTELCWPDFGPKELYKAVDEFSRRSRRFGDVANRKGGGSC